MEPNPSVIGNDNGRSWPPDRTSTPAQGRQTESRSGSRQQNAHLWSHPTLVRSVSGV